MHAGRSGDPPAATLAVDADVTRARTLGKAFYLDPAMFDLARERVFARSWQWIGELTDLAEPGSLSPRTLLPGHLDEPVLLARDAGGALRCLSNVCTHRGNPLVHVSCRGTTQIRCGYHSRRFDLDGRMRFMPAFEGAHDFPSPADDLPPVPFADLGGLLAFASVAPAAPFEEVFAPIEHRLGWLPWSEFVPDAVRSRDYEFDAHWALYVENYLEGLHIPSLHPGLMRSLDWRQYRYELHAQGNLQLGLDERGAVVAHYFWLFPNLMLNFYPWGLSLNQVLPLAPGRTRVIFRSYVAKPELLGQGAGGALDAVEMEDEAAVQSVQRGIRARAYRGGRYSPQHERGVHHFHHLLAQALA